MAGIVSFIRDFAGDLVLNRKLRKLRRNKKMINLLEARSVVLVYKVTDERRFNAVKKIIKELSTKKREVLALGYIDDVEMPDYLIATRTGFYFNNQNLNWFGAPKLDYLKKFISKEYDILIDLSTSNDYIIHYIIALSNSKLKVGRHRAILDKYFDLMINVKKNAPLSEFVNEAFHYLTVLKSK